MKKRLFAIITVVAIIMSMSCVGAFADGAGPIFTSYEVIVTNKDGATLSYYDYDNDNDEDTKIVIPYDTKVSVYGEYYENGKLILSVGYNDEYGNVKASDVKKLSEEVGKSDACKVREPFSMICLNKNGSAIRKGPSEFYDKVGTVPYNTTIKVEYADCDYSSNMGWAYVTCNGATGWVYVAMYDAGYDFAMILDENSDMTGEIEVADKGVKLVDLSEDSKTGYDEYKAVSDSIPVGTVLEFDKYYECAKNIFVYTKYNGVSGWLIADEWYNGPGYKEATALGMKCKIITTKPEGIKMYSEPYDGGEFTGEYLKYNTLTETDMNTHDFSQYEGKDEDDYENYKYFYSFRITVNGKTGWVTIDDDDDSTYFNVWGSYDTMIMEKTDLYSEPDSNSEVITTIPQYSRAEEPVGRTYEGSDNEFEYVVCNGKGGWILKDVEVADTEYVDYVALSKNTMYKTPDGKEKVKDIPKWTEISPEFSYYDDTDNNWYYIEYDGAFGWVSSDYYDYIGNIESDQEGTDEEETDENAAPNTLTEKNKYSDLLNGTTVKSIIAGRLGMSSTNLIICCVSAAGILLVCAAVTIIFVNKNKSKKAEPEAEENKEENSKD